VKLEEEPIVESGEQSDVQSGEQSVVQSDAALAVPETKEDVKEDSVE
jgi:hypothetical protein